MRDYTYEQLSRRVAKLERLVFNEGKQVGTLYHICDAKAFIKYILPKDQLKASGNYSNFLYGDNDYISFTRNRHYTLGHDLSGFSGVFIRLVIDGDRLSDNYKIGPYNDAYYDRSSEDEYGHAYGGLSGEGDRPEAREQEEVVKGPITNLSKYIKEIQLDVGNLTDDVMRALKSVSAKLKNVNVVYNNFMKQDQSPTVRKCIRAAGLTDGASLPEILVALKKATKLNPEPLLFSGDISKVQKAIDDGADLDNEYNRGWVLSFYCGARNDRDIVKLLLDSGADVNVGNGKQPPICNAAAECSPDIVNMLLKAGADVDAVDSNGSNAIIRATRNDNAIPVLKLLIKAGADVNHVNNYGMTALKLAHGDVKDLLIEAGTVE